MRKRLYILMIASWLIAVGTFAQRLTLDSCLQLAQRNNPALRKSQLSVLRAEQVKSQALTKYFPQIQGTAFGYHALHPIIDVGIDDISNASVRDLLTTLYGNYGAALGLQNTFSLFQHGYMVGVTAIQPVFMGGKIVAGNRLAQVGVEAARLQAQITERDALEQVEESYWLVYGLQCKQSIIDDATRLVDTVYQIVNGAVEAGLALPSDLTKVEIRRDDIYRHQLQLESGIRLASQALALSVGLPLTETIQPADTLSDTIPDLMAMAQAADGLTPEAQLLQLQIRAAQLQRKMALADALPQLAVGANYSYSRWQNNFLRNGLGSPTGNGAVFVTLTVPITAWWETGHKLKEHDYALEQARIDQAYIGEQLNLRTRQAYDRMAEAAAMWQLQQRTAEHARVAYEQTLVNYKAGMTTITELLQAQMAWTQAKADLTDAQIAYRVQSKRYTDLTAQ